MSLRSFFFGLILSCTLSDAVAQSARLPSNTLYGCSFRQNSRLYTIDPVTGEETEIGRIGEECTDLAFSGKVLYGLSFDNIFQIDPLTGEASAAMPHGFAELNAMVEIPNEPSGFYASAARAESPDGAPFVRIDKTTGKASMIGRLGKGLSSAGDFAWFNGRLFATLDNQTTLTTWLATIDTKTGRATLIADTGIEGIWGLEVRNGKMFGVTKLGWVLTIDPVNGQCTLVGTTGLVLGGLAKSP